MPNVGALIRDDGSPIKLGRQLGKGGEGAVYEIVGSPTLVAKIYHRPIEYQKAEKILTMVQLRTDKLLNLAAWPIGVLRPHPNGQITGLLMRNIQGYKEIHRLYSPKNRKAEFPKANWAFLIHSAANIARAFAVIHEHGVVVGDVNYGNVMVSSQALISLIDCDSFQVLTNGKKFLCEVGVPTFTPPELLGRDFKSVIRTANHDNFGLAVLAFHLLFMGRHPFAGRFMGKGDMPIERAIKEFRFPYSNVASSSLMQQPPSSLQLSEIPQNVAELFERAFSRSSMNLDARPSALEWSTALSNMSKELKVCTTNSSHLLYKKIPECGWCRIESQTGVFLFTIRIVLPGTPGIAFDLESLWTQVLGIVPPGPAPTTPDLRTLRVLFKPSARAVEVRKAKRIRMSVGIGLVAATIVTVTLLDAGAPGFWAILVAIFIGMSLMQAGGIKSAKEQARQQWTATQTRYDSVLGRLMSDTSCARYREVRTQLEVLRTEYANIPAVRAKRLKQLDQEQHSRQLTKFLEKVFIASATIPSVGTGRKSMLASYGIETAADVTLAGIDAVPGFGPKYTANILAWRIGVERKFRFDPSKGTDPEDIRVIEKEISERKLHVEHSLTAGLRKLQEASQQTKLLRTSAEGQLHSAIREMLQAEIDFHTM